GSTVAWALIAVEAVVAAALLAPIAEVVTWGTRGALVLFALFGGFIAVVLQRREPVYCYCFGEATQPLGAVDLVRNLLLLGGCGLALRYGAGHTTFALSTWLAVAAGGVVAFLVSAHLTTLAFLLAPATEESPLG
ncbi:MAG: MauE/DoxX family redox-associated membrane protein, partial [Pseudomonadota bacterium]